MEEEPFNTNIKKGNRLNIWATIRQTTVFAMYNSHFQSLLCDGVTLQYTIGGQGESVITVLQEVHD